MKGLGWLLLPRRWRSKPTIRPSPPALTAEATSATIGGGPSTAEERQGRPYHKSSSSNGGRIPCPPSKVRRLHSPEGARHVHGAVNDDNAAESDGDANAAYHRRALLQALDKRLPFEGIRFLIEQCPEALRPPPASSGASSESKGPLAMALERRYPLVAIRYLVEKGGPAGADLMLLHRGPGGALPMHVAVRGYHDEQLQIEVARYLVQQCPQSLRHQDAAGRLPLHAALYYGAPVELAWLLVEEYPASLQIKDAQGRLPVHVAAAAGSPLGLLRGLMDLCPASLHVEDATGGLPLHLAVIAARRRSRQTAEAAVGLLVERYPLALRVADSQGRLPLHWAAANLSGGGDDDDGYGVVVRAVLEACPAAAREQDSHGSLPLHLLLSAGASTELVRDVVHAFPMALGHADQSGSLPLHLAASSGSIHSADTARFLVEQHPNALEQVDGRGFLPLHAAVSSTSAAPDPNAALELAQLLVDGWPASIRVPSQDCGALLPLHLAASNPTMPVDAVFFLLRSWPEALIGS
jgi:ankyrin repeat protein